MNTPTQISLRKLTLEDSQFILTLTTDKDWLRNIGDRGVTDNASAGHYIQDNLLSMYETDGLGLMGIEEKHSGKVVGLCGLLQREYFEFPDLGFALLPQFRGLGYVFAAAQMTLESRLAKASKIILATTLPNNIASIKTLRKLGFDSVGDIEIHAERVKLMMRTSSYSARASSESGIQ